MTESLRSELQAAGGTESPSSPVTACLRCRKQKLRCSRSIPACKRCSDLPALCEYPPPPDRKLLAARRFASAKARARYDSETAANSTYAQQTVRRDTDGCLEPIESQDAPLASELEGHQSQRPALGSSRASFPQMQAALKRVTLPSAEVAAFLFEIYFSRLYNSNLLFHKRTFLVEYQANRVPDFVALSIFALASIFLGSSPELSLGHPDQDGVDIGISMLSTSDSARQGFEWATAGSQRALMQSDIPKLETVQACQNLALYWFSIGQTYRAYTHTHMAYRIARLLNLHVPHRRPSESEESELADELGRRCFWSCWITNCISQDNADFKVNPWEDVVGLPFPSDEESYSSGIPRAVECFEINGRTTTISLGPEASTPSVMAELVKLFGLWWEIQKFVKLHRGKVPANQPDRMTILLELDQRLSLVFENLHANFRVKDTSSFWTPDLDPYRVFSIYSLYRLCACALHTSIVPFFSGTLPTPQISKKMTKLSAEESVKHAAATLEMASIFITTRPDISRLPSITGYAMFVACTVHLKSLLAQKKLQSHRISHFKGAISILERLKEYWNTNRELWMVLKILFSDNGIDVDSISRSETRQGSRVDEQPTDLDKIVSHKPTPQETGRADIYTYVASEEARGGSPHHSHDSNHTLERSSAQFRCPHRRVLPLNYNEKSIQAHGVEGGIKSYEVISEARAGSPTEEVFTQTSACTGSLSPFDVSRRNLQNYPIATTFPDKYTSLNSVLEEHQVDLLHPQPPAVAISADQGMGFEDFSNLLTTEMEIDSVELWWNQPYGVPVEGELGYLVDGSRNSRSGTNHILDRYPFQ